MSDTLLFTIFTLFMNPEQYYKYEQMKENQLVRTAQKHFRENTGLDLLLDVNDKKIEDVDGQIIIIDPDTGKKNILYFEIKNEIRTHDLLKLKQHYDRYKSLMLIAQYISKKNKEQLRHLDINYIESSGNCYIRHKGLRVFVDNQKSAPVRKTGTSKLFTYSGMKFIYALLLKPDLITETYREIAYSSEIALGSVGDIIQELKNNGYLKQHSGENRIVKLKELFEDWVDYFDERVIPHIFQEVYVFADKDAYKNWQNIPMKNSSWGGEPAARLLDQYLAPETFVIYNSNSSAEVMNQFRLIPDIRGNVTLMLPLLENQELKKHADPFMIYAELMRSDDSRCHEAAYRIREKYIDPQF